jgi:valyl-tRNA synthetase
MNISPSLRPKTSIFIKSNEKVGLKDLREYIESQAKCIVEFIDSPITNPVSSAFTMTEDIDIWVNLEGMIDVEAEIKRIEKEISKVEKDVTFLNKRLANEDYLKNAPQDVVDDDKIRLKGYVEKLSKLKENIKILKEMR